MYFILDLGTGFSKLGISLDEIPYIVEPTCIGFPRFALDSDSNEKEPLFGWDAFNFKGSIDREDVFDLKSSNHENLTKYLHFLFNKLKLNTEGQHLVLSIALDWPGEFVDDLKRIMFQEFNFASIYAEISDIFAVIYYDNPHVTVIDIGYLSSRVVPFDDYKIVQNAVTKSNVGNQLMNQYLKFLLLHQFKYIHSPVFDGFAEKIKTEKCRFELKLEEKLSDDAFLREIQETLEVPQFKIPLIVGIEKILTPEILFEPVLMGLEQPAIHELLINSVKSAHPSIRPKIYKNIILVGGAVKIPHFHEKLKQKLQVIPILANANYYIDADPQYLIWKGMRKSIQTDFFKSGTLYKVDFSMK